MKAIADIVQAAVAQQFEAAAGPQPSVFIPRTPGLSKRGKLSVGQQLIACGAKTPMAVAVRQLEVYAQVLYSWGHLPSDDRGTCVVEVECLTGGPRRVRVSLNDFDWTEVPTR